MHTEAECDNIKRKRPLILGKGVTLAFDTPLPFHYHLPVGIKMDKLGWIIIITGIIAITIAILLKGQLISLEYMEFPRDELERLIITTDVPEQAPILTGPIEVQITSSWTRWAMRFSPGTFLVDVKINGHKTSLVVDTGAAKTAISPRVATAARVSLTSSRLEAQHGKQDTPVYMGWVQELSLNDLKVSGVPIIVMGNQPVLKLFGIPVFYLGGLLGMETLQLLAITLDYERGAVILRREAHNLQASWVPLRILRDKGPGDMEHPRPIVDCLLEGYGPLPCWIDTGASAPVYVPPEVWGKLGLGDQKQARLKIKLGEVDLKDVPAVRARVPYTMIGSNIFQAQGIKRLTLDFLAGKLYAER
jgi:predicted aspartyl protease